MLGVRFLSAIKDVPREHLQEFAAKGVREGHWSEEEVTHFFSLPDREPPRKRQPRAPSPPRQERLSKRRCVFSRYVRRFSTDVLTHPHLSKGAVMTLIYLISRCGRRKQVTTCTNWVATDLGVSTRTIQNHYQQLERAGFIVRSSPDKRGRTTVYLTERVEVHPFKRKGITNLESYGETAKKNAATDEMNSTKRGLPAKGDEGSQVAEDRTSSNRFKKPNWPDDEPRLDGYLDSLLSQLGIAQSANSSARSAASIAARLMASTKSPNARHSSTSLGAQPQTGNCFGSPVVRHSA